MGVTNLRGVMLPVLDLRRRLGTELRDATPTTAVIVVRLDGDGVTPLVVGCVVDSVSDVANIDAASVQPHGRDNAWRFGRLVEEVICPARSG